MGATSAWSSAALCGTVSVGFPLSFPGDGSWDPLSNGDEAVVSIKLSTTDNIFLVFCAIITITPIEPGFPLDPSGINAQCERPSYRAVQ
jgi:hypothetical protein